MISINKEIAKSFLPARAAGSNKGSHGKTLALCGSSDMMGAAILACKAAFASGAGYVISAVPETEKNVIFTSVPEAVVLPLPAGREVAQIQEFASQNNPDVLLCGCGLGPAANQYIDFISSSKIPAVLDGDALNAIAARSAAGARVTFGAAVILTPHPLEAARLLGVSEIAKDDSSRAEAARAISDKYNAVCVLKGQRTIVCYKEKIYINTTGSDALAKAGTGDVLAGLISGFWAQHGKQNGFDFNSALKSAACAVYIHGAAGEMSGADFSSYSVMASMLPAYIGAAIKEIL